MFVLLLNFQQVNYSVRLYMNTKQAAILTIVVAALYSAAVYCAQPKEIWNWLNTLVGTGLSFFLAILAGIYLFNRQNEISKKSETEDLRSILTAEFSDLVRILSATERMSITFPSGDVANVLIAFIQPLATEKSALSGLFSRIESENLLHIARKVRMFNFKSEYFMGLVQSRANEPARKNAIDNMEQNPYLSYKKS